MSLFRTSQPQPRSPFSEIRQIDRDQTWFVIAASTLGATGFLIAGVLVALGVMA